MDKVLKESCPWCGQEDHLDWCPDNKGLRQKTTGLPSYMKFRKRVEKE